MVKRRPARFPVTAAIGSARWDLHLSQVAESRGVKVGRLKALGGMRSFHSDDSIDDFTVELLRAGEVLSGLAEEIGEALPADAYSGEAPGEVALQMLSGSVRTFLSSADARDVERATELMAGAVDRIVEHLALALRGRMDGDDGADLDGEVQPSAPAGNDAAREAQPPPRTPVNPADPADALDGLAAALLDCGGLLSQMMAAMIEYDAAGNASPDMVPIPEAAHRLVHEVIAGVRGRHSQRELAQAAEIVGEATEAIANDIFFVAPDLN